MSAKTNLALFLGIDICQRHTLLVFSALHFGLLEIDVFYVLM